MEDITGRVILIDAQKKPVIPDSHFHPSPTKLIRFSDGKVVPLNRKQRRRMGIYNKDLRRGNE